MVTVFMAMLMGIFLLWWGGGQYQASPEAGKVPMLLGRIIMLTG